MFDVLDVINEYSKRNLILDKAGIKQIVEILKRELYLVPLVKTLRFYGADITNNGEITLGQYDANEDVLSINTGVLPNIIKYNLHQVKGLYPRLTYMESIYLANFSIVETIVHECIHVKQNIDEIKNNNSTIEKQIVNIEKRLYSVGTKGKSKQQIQNEYDHMISIYRKYYDKIVFERLARIKSNIATTNMSKQIRKDFEIVYYMRRYKLECEYMKQYKVTNEFKRKVENLTDDYYKMIIPTIYKNSDSLDQETKLELAFPINIETYDERFTRAKNLKKLIEIR